MARWPSFVLLFAVGCGSGSGPAPVLQEPLQIRVDVLAGAVVGTPVPMLVSVRRGNATARDYVGVVEFECDDPTALYPAAYEFTSSDQGQRAFSTGFLFNAGVHVLTVTGEGIDGTALFAITVESPVGPPTPPPGYVPPPPTGTSPGNNHELLTRIEPVIEENWGTGLALADVDGDGDVDLLTCVWLSSTSSATTLRLNNGDGSFTSSSQTFPGAANAVFADVDGDGDQDIVLIATETTTPYKDHLWINNGKGAFTETGQGFGIAGYVASGDVDGDGDDDLVECAGTSLTVHVSNGKGGFSSTLQGQSILFSHHLPVLGDLDGDGDLDLVAGRTVLVNNGVGQFSASAYAFSERDVRVVSLADMDGDGDLDIVLGNYYQANDLYLNDDFTGGGSGAFTKSYAWQTPDTCTVAIAVLDVDEDGDLDIVEGNGSANDVIWINEGATFTGMQVAFTYDDTSFVVGDLNGDGLPDVVGSRMYPTEMAWYRND